MYERFLDHYTPGPRPLDASDLSPLASGAHGWSALFEAHSGTSFDGGLYRLHRDAEIGAFTDLVQHAWPRLSGEVLCFASDWRGRQFALREHADGEPSVLILDPGTGGTVELSTGLCDLHDRLLVDLGDVILDRPGFADWAARRLGRDGTAPVLETSRCAGYLHLPLLGGEQSRDNLALVEMRSYWHRAVPQIRASAEADEAAA